MKKIIYLLFLVLLGCGLVSAQELTPFFDGKVLSVLDGDTFTVRRDNGNEVRVRLQGTNAPEKGQRFSAEARQNLIKKILGKQIRVEFSKTDKIGRILGKVILDEEDVGREQIYAGLAWYYTYFANELSNDDRFIYDETQELARKEKNGLWQEASPLSPWAYRALHKIDESVEMQIFPPSNPINANRQTKTYFRFDCAGYKTVVKRFRLSFSSEEAAIEAGYTVAKTCR